MSLKRAVAALAALFSLGDIAYAQESGDDRRVALVIGNADYADMGALTNPVRDARGVAASLSQAGFSTVVTAENVGIDAFNKSLREFRRVADGASLGLIYFAGHGLEVYGRNWLVPLGAAIAKPEELQLEAIALDQLLTAIEGATVKVVILDACRNNPFERALRVRGAAMRSADTSAGLAPIADAALTDGMIVMYAAAPGMTASDGLPQDANSPFARALMEKLPTPELDVRLVAGGIRDLTMRYTDRLQRPFVTSSLGEMPVYITPKRTFGAMTGGRPVESREAEVSRMFTRAKAAADGGDCQALEDFLGAVPTASNAAEAGAAVQACRRGFLDSLRRAGAPAPLTMVDFRSFAAEFGIEVSALRAVVKVESGPNAYDASGRPLILYEPHIFSRLTEHRFDESHPAISYPSWGGRPYARSQDDRWAQLREAYQLDAEAAVASASWGRFQILGMNFGPAGFGSATEFVSAMSKSEVAQLRAVLTFIQTKGLLDEIVRLDWEGLARGYNGVGQVDKYGRLLREAYAVFKAEESSAP